MIIVEHIPLETARKDIQFANREPYTGERDQISEWAVALALQNFEEGEEISEEEFEEACAAAVIQQTLNKLVDDGLVDMFWDDGEPKYRITEEGKKAAE